MSQLIIGVGNRYRGDDAIGLVAVEAIGRDPELRTIATLTMTGDLSDLVLRWSCDDDVVVIDALASGRPPGSIVVLDGLSAALGPEVPVLSTHGIGLAGAIALADRLGRLPRSLWLVAVEVGQTEHLAPLSKTVLAAVDEVTERVRELTGPPIGARMVT